MRKGFGDDFGVFALQLLMVKRTPWPRPNRVDGHNDIVDN